MVRQMSKCPVDNPKNLPFLFIFFLMGTIELWNNGEAFLSNVCLAESYRPQMNMYDHTQLWNYKYNSPFKI